MQFRAGFVICSPTMMDCGTRRELNYDYVCLHPHTVFIHRGGRQLAVFLTRICARRSHIQYDNVSTVLCKFLPPVDFLVIREMSPEPMSLPRVNADAGLCSFCSDLQSRTVPPILGFKSDAQAQPAHVHSYCALINHHRQFSKARGGPPVDVTAMMRMASTVGQISSSPQL